MNSPQLEAAVFAGCQLCRARSTAFRDYFKSFESPGIADRMAAIIRASQRINQEGRNAAEEVMQLPLVEAQCPQS